MEKRELRTENKCKVLKQGKNRHFKGKMNEAEGEMSRLVGVPRSGHGNL